MKPNSDNLHSNRTSQHTEAFAVSTDVTRWRQDVEAFTSTTRQMLDSIHQQLSNGLANGQMQVKIAPSNQTPNAADERPRSPSPLDNQISNQHPLPQNDADETAFDIDQMLSRLKAQLAEQLNR